MSEFSRDAAVDLGDDTSEVCATVPNGGKQERRTLKTTPEAFRKYFGKQKPMRVVIEVGTHSRWVSELLKELGHEVIVANPRMLPLLQSFDDKSDVKDAEKLLMLLRMGPEYLKPVQHRSEQEQADLVLAHSRGLMVESRTKAVNYVRGVVKSFGVRIRKCSTDAFVKKANEDLPVKLLDLVGPVLQQIESLSMQIRAYDREIERVLDRYPVAKRLREQIDGVGPVTALVYVLVVQSPDRFEDLRKIGSYLGLRPKKKQSGSIDRQLRITKAGDMYLRVLLIQCAHHILGVHGKDSDLRRWGLELAARGGKNGKKRAAVAVARKLAVLMGVLWDSGEDYEPLRNTTRRARLAA